MPMNLTYIDEVLEDVTEIILLSIDEFSYCLSLLLKSSLLCSLLCLMCKIHSCKLLHIQYPMYT